MRSTVFFSSRTLPGQSNVGETIDRVLAEGARRHPLAFRENPREVVHEQRNVLAAVAQRRHDNRDDVQSIEQILAELSFGNLGLERLVRRGDHAHVDRDRLRAANAIDDAIFEHAQHLCLRARAHVADLVEKERAAVRLFEFSGAIRDSTGERSFDVPKELALDELTRNRRAVHLDEGLGGARRQAMQRARDELFPGAVLAGDQHARGGGGDALDLLDERADREGLSDDLVARLDARAQPRVLLAQHDVLERVAERDLNAIGVEGLLEKVVGAELRRLDRRLNGSVPADHHDDRGTVELTNSLERLEPVDTAHLHIHEDQIGVPLLVLGDRIDGVRDGAYFVAVVLEELTECGANPFLVIRNEDLRAHRTTL